MKYSLRSLMTFSIRDIALVTVTVAVLLAWLVDHRRQAAEIQRQAGQIKISTADAIDAQKYRRAVGRTPKNLPQSVRESVDEVRLELYKSSAPAPNPPNNN